MSQGGDLNAARRQALAEANRVYESVAGCKAVNAAITTDSVYLDNGAYRAFVRLHANVH